MNIPKRLVFLCLVVFLLLAGCGTAGNPTPIVITATPGMEPTTIVITATPAPADPTPTAEVGQYVIVNSNPYFQGFTEYALESDDAQRRQYVSEEYTPTARWYYESGVRVAPWIFHYPLNDNSGRARLQMEFTQIAGEFGLYTRVTLSAGQCYILKQTGNLRINRGDMRNLALGARVILSENGSALELQEQSFPGIGTYDIAWRLRPLVDTTVNVEIYLMVRWAEFSAVAEAAAAFLDVDGVEVTEDQILEYYLSQANAAINEIDSFQVLLSPQAECPAGATWEW